MLRPNPIFVASKRLFQALVCGNDPRNLSLIRDLSTRQKEPRKAIQKGRGTRDETIGIASRGFSRP